MSRIDTVAAKLKTLTFNDMTLVGAQLAGCIENWSDVYAFKFNPRDGVHLALLLHWWTLLDQTQ